MNPSDLQAWIVAVAAGLAALGYIFKQAQRLFRTLDSLSALLNHELTHNGGSSLKDQATTAAVASASNAQAVARIEAQVEKNTTHLADLADLVNKHLSDPAAHGG